MFSPIFCWSFFKRASHIFCIENPTHLLVWFDWWHVSFYSWLLYLLHGGTQDIVSFVEGHLHWSQELQPVPVHPLTALLCTARKQKNKTKQKHVVQKKSKTKNKRHNSKQEVYFNFPTISCVAVSRIYPSGICAHLHFCSSRNLWPPRWRSKLGRSPERRSACCSPRTSNLLTGPPPGGGRPPPTPARRHGEGRTCEPTRMLTLSSGYRPVASEYGSI